MIERYDMHCHLDFAVNATDVATQAAQLGITGLSATVTPAGYRTAYDLFDGIPSIHVGLGLHPWWIVDGTEGLQTLEQFEAQAVNCPIIGEVGLDFSGRAAASQETQITYFHRILDACPAGKLFTIHAVRSVSKVLDLLEAADALKANRYIFHWFSGTSQELSRAIKAGCYFSVGPHMLQSKKGREYARVIPIRQLLMETDEPPQNSGQWSAQTWYSLLSETMQSLAALRNEDMSILETTLANTGQLLLEC